MLLRCICVVLSLTAAGMKDLLAAPSYTVDAEVQQVRRVVHD